MKARARFLGHPIHQMLIVFPLGLLGTAVVFDLIYLVTHLQSIALVAYWMLAAGIVGAAAAIPFGIIDYTIIPAGTRAKRIGLMHGFGNGVVSVLFVLSWIMREQHSAPSASALACSFLGLVLALITAWLGGELVSKLGVGVHEHASPNAPSSLKKEQR
ncbi:DUF2231 domain-containing protein [Methylophilus methylotrophus]|uniref:DUF2231 domain-containing protein n=1 Tax=Methylophilus methylotrophus TaxID=17 RepID=UPI000476BC19|nr:DUF2231 domain-containing protein [Methylophilus methylotrophus]